MSSPTRLSSLAARLVRLGFDDPSRAERLLSAKVFAGIIDPFEDVFDDGLLSALGDVPDPDLALLGLVRLLESLEAGGSASAAATGSASIGDGSSAGDRDRAALHVALRSGGRARDRLLAVLGNSTALGDHLARHPAHWAVLTDDGPPPTAEQVRAQLLTAVGAGPDDAEPVATLEPSAAQDALRVAYRRELLAIAGRDVVDPEPISGLPATAAALADLAAAALETALAIARSQLLPGASPCRIAVLGMGKCGGRELNYVSDVDVIYVVEPPEGGDEAGALATGSRLAAGLARVCSASTAEGTLWPVDAALRPEGKNGPLVRSVDSHVSYYRRWAATWEFQALLKARVVAGDRELGEAYLEAIRPMVWRAAERENFVADVQAMRRRVEEHLPRKEAARQLKLGAGGLRDVEFSVQLLQLVHGRADPRLRTGNTLEALEALSAFGYVGRDDAAELDEAYRMLRTLEHRIQLFRLRRTHIVPDDPAELRRLGRSFGFRSKPADELDELWHRHAIEVRRLHEKLFYRPLLAAAARLTTDEVRLTPEAARARLAALGYRDPAGAMRHLQALTSGVSRRAAIQRQLLSVMLGWFAGGADPDAGLLAFRRVSDELGTTHWYLKMLRDSGAAAERMAHVLSASRLVAQLLERAPEAVAMFGNDAELSPRDRDATTAAARRAVDRHEGDPVGADDLAPANASGGDHRTDRVTLVPV
ncbi:MAG TPA: bifunctional [glutamine synthetase] adenylyltransferase/[glutamine synthetase]-adenylyl-L-tyrosine phosphorylase, partial [Kineosporiaceae bacterium]|nr:bifunctional [glutamine synthetase] adenylyltransferase/[glutamine synthetase]-adenylyl-L-tyrosine phosphorylase [Kineosporiaceae bacterium]